MTTEELNKRMSERAKAFPGNMSVIVEKIDDMGNIIPGLSVRIDADRRQRSASMIKVPVLCALIKEIGIDNLDKKIPVRGSDILYDSLVYKNERESSFYELAYFMIVNSDNTAANVLMNYLTFDKINKYCLDLGLLSTRAERLMLDEKAVAEGRNNYTSPSDFEKLMLMLYRDSFSGNTRKKEEASLILKIMGVNRDFDEFMRYIYEDVVFMHKTGELDDVEHDAGILTYKKNKYFVGIFSTEMNTEIYDNEKGEIYLSVMGREIMDYISDEAG